GRHRHVLRQALRGAVHHQRGAAVLPHRSARAGGARRPARDVRGAVFRDRDAAGGGSGPARLRGAVLEVRGPDGPGGRGRRARPRTSGGGIPGSGRRRGRVPARPASGRSTRRKGGRPARPPGLVASAGGQLFDDEGKPHADSAEAITGIQTVRDGFDKGLIPQEALTYKEEESRAAYQDGRLAFLQNWPYVWALGQAEDGSSKVNGKMVASVVPGIDGPGSSTLGGLNLG